MSTGRLSEKSTAWKLIHSSWCLLAVFKYGWLALIYIGVRVKKKSWLIFGAIYALVYFLMKSNLILWMDEYILHNYYGHSWLDTLNAVLPWVYWIVSCIHCIIFARPEYLMHIAAMEDQTIKVNMQDQRRLAEQLKTAEKFDKSTPKKAEAVTRTAGNAALNINRCSAEELAAIPGMNEILSQKVMQFRDKQGEFSSVDEFVDYVHLRPRIAERVKNSVTV